MFSRRLAAVIAVLFCLNTPATAAMYTIDNPAAKISNPADKMYNPATQVNNPAENIYNPATRMTDPNPLSPPVQAVPQPAAEVPIAKRPVKQAEVLPTPASTVPAKSYNLKSAREYVNAAKRAFVRDEYMKFVSITEDALRRISAGTLKASKKTRQQLVKYKVFGYGLLE